MEQQKPQRANRSNRELKLVAREGRSERVTGIEPALSAWEADVLPLNYTRRRRQTSPRGGSLAVLAQTWYRNG